MTTEQIIATFILVFALPVLYFWGFKITWREAWKAAYKQGLKDAWSDEIIESLKKDKEIRFPR